TATPAPYTLSLHDALPIYCSTVSPEPGSEAWLCPAGVPADTSISPSAPKIVTGFSKITDRRPAISDSPPPSSTTLVNRLCISSRSEEHTSELQSRFDLVCR